MQIAQVFGGYSLGEADNLRRAMGKKKKEVMEVERERFVDGAVAQGHDRGKAETIFAQMETFAAYGFNKSHSAAYALITYHTAWLKAHYPREFLAALLTMEMGSTDATYKNLADCRSRNIRVLPPDVNSSRADFTVCPEGIRFGLGAVRGVGEKAIDVIVAAREDGTFQSLGDFCARVTSAQVTRRIIEGLCNAGALESLHASRARLLAGIDGALAWASRVAEDRAAGQMGLFGAAGGTSEPEPELPDVTEWSMLQKLEHEHDAVGFYISGHPLDRYEVDLALLATRTTGDLSGLRDKDKVRLAGVTNTVRRKNSRKGDRYATFNLEDRDGVIEVIAWPECYKNCEAAIIGREPVMVTGGVEFGESGGSGFASDNDGEAALDFSRKAQIIADEVIPLAEARRRAAQSVDLRMFTDRFEPERIDDLRATLQRYPGGCRSYLRVIRPGDSETVIELPRELSVDPTDPFLDAAERLLGAGNVALRS